MRRVASVGAVLFAALAASEPISGQEMGHPIMGWHPTTFMLFEKLEYAPDAWQRPIVLEGIAWWGGARNRLWIRGEAEQVTSGDDGDAELEVLFGRLISPFFDALVGVRVDRRWGEDFSVMRGLLSVGLEGIAPLWWELAPTVFVSEDGDVSARLDASYALLFTQRLILEPRVELNAALQDVPAFGIASGLTDLELGARLRYEIRRKFAPYLGVSWLRRTGGTADLARLDGEPASDVSLVAGLRVWY